MFVYRDSKGKITDVLGSINVEDLEALQKGKDTSGEVVEVEPVVEEEVTAPEEAPEPEPEAEEESEGPPKTSDTKATWVDYAVSQGAEREAAESWTKQELVEMFGE